MRATFRSLLLAAVGAVALTASAVAQTPPEAVLLDRGAEAFRRGDHAAALRVFRPLAEKGSFHAQHAMGVIFLTEGDDAEALRWYRLAAEQGYAEAQYSVGGLYAYSEVVPKNDTEALKWYRLAAEQGHADAQKSLGVMYSSDAVNDYVEAFKWYSLAAAQGDKVSADFRDILSQLMTPVQYVQAQRLVAEWKPSKKLVDATALFSEALDASERADFGTALRLWLPLAEQGYADAQYNLGVMYANGNGVPENDTEAVRWFRRAAEQGYAVALYNLGNMYANGEGVPENDAEAVRWYRLAAEQSLAVAQLNLGVMYADGRGVPQNYVEAYKWWALSAAQGNTDAADNRDSIRRKMTPAQIAEAQRLAAAWRPSDTEPPPQQQAQPETEEPSDGSGTGFYVTASGHLVTNAHVVEGCRSLALANGSSLTLVDIDEAADLALLQRSGRLTTSPLSLRHGRGVRLADNVIVAGYPLAGLLSSDLNVTTGTVSALAGIGNDRSRIQMTAPVQPGNSGGPLLDQSGNVVGVVVSKLDAVAVASAIGDIPQNVNFAISLGTLQAFLDANGVDYKTRTSDTQLSNPDVAQIARASTVQIECRG